jgi:hypothetical protein
MDQQPQPQPQVVVQQRQQQHHASNAIAKRLNAILHFFIYSF